jgi:hypothetical protein
MSRNTQVDCSNNVNIIDFFKKIDGKVIWINQVNTKKNMLY